MTNFLTKAACASVAVLGMMLGGAAAADAKTLGIVALLANDALNIDVIVPTGRMVAGRAAWVVVLMP